jgi:hypothetical protein
MEKKESIKKYIFNLNEDIFIIFGVYICVSISF